MIPFFDQNLQYKNIKAEIDAAVHKVLESGWYILGEEVRQFETEFAAYHNAGYALGVANGTDAIFLSLKALGIGSGDEVIVPENTYVGTVNAVKMAGAQPIYSGVNKFHLIDEEKVKPLIRAKTKAIVPVHLYGQMCNMEALSSLAKKHNLYLVEDAAQAHGAQFNGAYPGKFSDAAAFSFYPTKNLGAFGDGGMIISNNPDVIERARFTARQGLNLQDLKFEGGVNSRLDEMQAAILRIKLNYLKAITASKIEAADLYSQALTGIKELEIPEVQPDCKHVFHQYVIRVPEAGKLQQYLTEKGITTERHYPYKFTQAGIVSKNDVLSLPLIKKYVGEVSKAIRAFFS